MFFSLHVHSLQHEQGYAASREGTMLHFSEANRVFLNGGCYMMSVGEATLAAV